MKPLYFLGKGLHDERQFDILLDVAIPEPESFATPDVTGIEDLLATFLDPERPYLADGEISDGVEALDRVRCLVDAAMTAGVDRLDGRQVYGFDGARSAAAWLRPSPLPSGGVKPRPPKPPTTTRHQRIPKIRTKRISPPTFKGGSASTPNGTRSPVR